MIRGMFSGNTQRLSLIDGLRGISVLWMVSFHAQYFFGLHTGPAEYKQFLGRFQPTFVANGHFGVDIFFVISGFLIADILLREWERNGRIDYLKFYLRRAFRILPLYIVVLLVSTLAGLYSVAQILPNLFFVNNFVPFEQQAMVWTWSLAIEEQFYLIFPALLGFLAWRVRDESKIVRVYAGLIVISMLTTGFLLVWTGIFAFPPAHELFDAAAFAAYFDSAYDKTYCRVGGILFGVIVAYWKPHRSPNPWSARRALVQRVLMYAALVLVLGFAFLPADDAPQPPAVVVGFLAMYRTLFAGAVALLLFCGLRAEFKRDPIVRFLSWPIWILFAELSYGAYLVHPFIADAAYKFVFSASWIAQHHVLWPVLFIEVITFVIALGTYFAIERPMRDLGRSYGRQR
jgi:peptidoglycan/LPS O-acetylase OafA/YrhL